MGRIRNLAPIYEVRPTPEIVADVEQVAAETMRRVRANLITIVERLERESFVFNAPSDALCPPSPQVADELKEVDRRLTQLDVDGFAGRFVRGRAWDRKLRRQQRQRRLPSEDLAADVAGRDC